MDNPYAAPEANLKKPIEKGLPYNNSFNRSMIIAAIIMVVTISMIWSLTYFVEPSEVDIVEEVINYIFTVIQIVFAIYFIRRLRIRNLGASNEVIADELGIWGYCWRVVITILISLFVFIVPIVLVSIFTGFSLIERVPQLTISIAAGIVTFPIILLVIWLIFSKDRKRQFNSLMSIFRGY
jgi:hypothetical protein